MTFLLWQCYKLSVLLRKLIQQIFLFSTVLKSKGAALPLAPTEIKPWIQQLLFVFIPVLLSMVFKK